MDVIYFSRCTREKKKCIICLYYDTVPKNKKCSRNVYEKTSLLRTYGDILKE